MNRLDRLTAILLQLQTRRVVRAQELADRHEVNVRTIYRDLRTLEEAGVPLCGEPGVGFSLAEGYRLPPVMFSREEVSALLTAEKLAEQFTDPATARLTRAALDKVRAVLRRPERDYAEHLTPLIAVRQPLRQPPPAAGPDVRQPLLRSLAQHRVVRLHYRAAAHQPPTTRAVEPVGLYFHLHWHLLAYCRLRRELRNFRLDRIEALELLDERFAPRPETLHSYWQQQQQRPGQAVTLRFTARGYALVRDDKYLFGWEQEQVLPGGAVEMTLRVHALPAVAHWLLYFGEQVSIVGPGALRDAVRDVLTRAARHHFPPDDAQLPTDTP
ncbi:YafY family transcriptional regulator [Hymenobacter gummosus]|uniref:YafY family transcriptional regulator n=1 Tax=Hymenobacter gummosus TaxID=1776032 RepID=A0A431TW16_9BACT|nr:YafY family protein [Hymenobacter gummosus]RTQ45656.1 YafY family transcriptional regulator [Hymenobacter gummosus]